MKLLELDGYDCSWLARRSTGNHKNTRERWRVTISESVFLSAKLTFATPSVVLIVGWECEIAMPIMLHSASTTTSPNCDTVTLCYTPHSPTVTLSQARLRHVAVYGSSFQCEGSDLRVASPFLVGRSRSESKYKDFFSWGGLSFKWGNIRPVYWYYFQLEGPNVYVHATCSLVA